MRSAVLIMLIVCVSVHAQQPERKFRFELADGVLIGALAGDELTSPGARFGCRICREVGVVKNTGLRIGLKAGLFAGFKVLEFEFQEPRERRLIVIFKYATAAMFTAVALRNRSLK